MHLSLKIFNPCWAFDVAKDWGITAAHAELDQVMQEPFKIAAVPVLWDRADNFVNSDNLPDVPMNEFDLVVLSDIESYTASEIYNWIAEKNIGSYVVAVGAKSNNVPVNESCMIYRPWWMYNLMRMNQFRSTDSQSKSFVFDALLGTRRPHRDYVMLAMQKHAQLLNNSIVTYRDVFTGGFVDQNSQHSAECFPDQQLDWPYVSSNLDPEWEVTDRIEKNISPFLPYKIYQRTWFTVVCETLNTSTQFFLTEKTSKPLFAKRLFVVFGPRLHLKNLRDLGFKTFDSVIDEEYDLIELDSERYQQAFNQLLSLSQQDPRQVLDKVSDILEHNHNRMWQLQQETQSKMKELLLERLPQQYIISAAVV